MSCCLNSLKRPASACAAQAGGAVRQMAGFRQGAVPYFKLSTARETAFLSGCDRLTSKRWQVCVSAGVKKEQGQFKVNAILPPIPNKKLPCYCSFFTPRFFPKAATHNNIAVLKITIRFSRSASSRMHRERIWQIMPEIGV